MKTANYFKNILHNQKQLNKKAVLKISDSSQEENRSWRSILVNFQAKRSQLYQNQATPQVSLGNISKFSEHIFFRTPVNGRFCITLLSFIVKSCSLPHSPTRVIIRNSECLEIAILKTIGNSLIAILQIPLSPTFCQCYIL